MTYTAEQIRDMDAKQLAEATAIHVMEWRKVKPSNLPYDFEGYWVDYDGIWQYDCDNTDGNIWNPAEDIAAAWEVFEVLRAKYSWVGIDTMNSGYRCLAIDDEKDFSDGYGKTAPEAICKAALLAVMGL